MSNVKATLTDYKALWEIEMSKSAREIIEKVIHENDVVLFMKGSKRAPMCGYSGFVCQVLQKLNVDFMDVDVLSNPELREEIKSYSAWPTLPQLYIKQEFVGGADIVKELYETKALEKMVSEIGKNSDH